MASISNANLHEFGTTAKKVRYNSFDVLTKYASEKHWSFAKAVYVLGVDVPKLLGWMAEDNQTGILVKENLSMFKLWRSPFQFVDSVNTTVRSTWSYLTGNPIAIGRDKKPVVKPFSQVIRDAGGIINPVNEMLTILTQAIVYIPKASIHTLKGVNGVALSFLMGWSAFESLGTLSKDRVADLTNQDQITFRERENVGALLNLITQVSYVAIGVLSALSVFASVFVPPCVMTMLSATSVVFSILHFYHKNIGQEKQIN